VTREKRDPRLMELEGHLSVGDAASRRKAWDEFARAGLPLVEPVRQARGKVHVTFLWRPGSPLRAPTLYTPVANPFAGEMELRQLGRTGVWYRSLQLPKAVRAMYGFSPLPVPGSGPRAPSWSDYFRSLRADPYHRERIHMAKDPEDPEDVEASISVLSLPQAPRTPWNEVRAPAFWRKSQVRFRSPHLPGSRSVRVFLPPGAGRRSFDGNLVVVLDGVTYTSAVPTPAIVRNLIRAGRLEPTVVVAVGNAPGSRDLELLHNAHFAEFLAEELLPSIRARYGVRVEASRTLLGGSSLGGMASAHAALRYPQTFGAVLAQSGAYTWTDSGKSSGAPTLMREYAQAPRGPTRFYLSAGTFEDVIFPGSRMSLLTGVRKLRDVLVRKGYPVEYAEFEGGHDFACWSADFATGLLALLGRGRPRKVRRTA